VAEGAPLLREYGVYSLIEGSNPSLSAIYAYKFLFSKDLYFEFVNSIPFSVPLITDSLSAIFFGMGRFPHSKEY
jgi:hypothetical protein